MKHYIEKNISFFLHFFRAIQWLFIMTRLDSRLAGRHARWLAGKQAQANVQSRHCGSESGSFTIFCFLIKQWLGTFWSTLLDSSSRILQDPFQKQLYINQEKIDRYQSNFMLIYLHPYTIWHWFHYKSAKNLLNKSNGTKISKTLCLIFYLLIKEYFF